MPVSHGLTPVATAPALDLTLVIDIGKTNARLFMLDDAGQVVERHNRGNASVQSALGYPALDVRGLEGWMKSTLRASPHAMRCGHAIASTHGAAIVALAGERLAWEPIDYEFEGVAQQGAMATAFDTASDPFNQTLSPDLPAGLNAARQLFWMQNAHPDEWRKTQCLLPYPQYWAWLLSGVACSEVSSLGCHTHLWNPARADFSSLAADQGWASLFAPLRSAWEVIGPVRPAVASEWGLPAGCKVHAGVHDSNACLARYLDSTSADPQKEEALTIVSSGTWTVLMAPGASAESLVAGQDMLGNVDVTGRVTPTARFMGGREFAAILQGADPQAASAAGLKRLVESKTFAFPAFSHAGGPFAERAGYQARGGHLQSAASAINAEALDDSERAALAATYCAQVTAWLIDRLWRGHATRQATTQADTQPTVIVEGPLASNAIYMHVLQSMLPGSLCYASTDELEGTARGAWLLTRWGGDQARGNLKSVPCEASQELREYHAHWLEVVNEAARRRVAIQAVS